MRSSFVVLCCCKVDVLHVQCMLMAFSCKGDTSEVHNNEQLLQEWYNAQSRLSVARVIKCILMTCC